MKKIKILSIFFTALFLFLNCVGNVFGAGFNNTNIGIKGIGMGLCLTGIADDASAVYYNPGGLVFNDKNTWYAEVYGYYALTKFEYTEDSKTEESNDPVIIPSLFISKTYENWGVGFGFYVPFAGGGTAYDNFQNSGVVCAK